MQQQIVGIIGGMGPEATVDLMRRVIDLTPAEDDADHLRMLVDNNPQVPSRIAALIEKTGPSPGPVLCEMAAGLERSGANFLAIPCNTAHHYYDEISAAVDVPLLNIMQLCATHIAEQRTDCQRVGLLASTALRQIQLYEPWLEARGLSAVFPDVTQQSRLMALIRAVKAGSDKPDLRALNDAAANLANAGADCLLIACTEISVVAEHLRSPLPVDDAAQLLAQEIVRRAHREQADTHS